MKRKIVIIFITIFSSITVFSQSQFVSSISNPGGMAIHNNFLYYTTDSANENIRGRIYKVDLSLNNPTREIVFLNIFSPRDLALHGSELYILCLNGDLYKANLDETNPTLSFLQNVTGGTSTSTRTTNLTIHNGFIYISLKDQKKIVRIPLNNLTQSPEEIIVTGLSFPSRIVFVGNDMYFLDFIFGFSGGQTLRRLKDTDKSNAHELIIEKASDVNDMKVNGDYIYMIHGNSTRKISRLDTNINPIPTTGETLINGLDADSVYMLIHKNEIFVSTLIIRRIQRFNVNTLNVKKFNIQDVSIFPNPASNSLQISSSQSINKIEIFSALGKRVLQQTSADLNNKAIDVSSLTNGMYLLKINDKQFKKLIKN